MSAWSSLSINFAPFQSLLSPLKSILQLLEVVESILEALLDLIRAFLLDLSNPPALRNRSSPGRGPSDHQPDNGDRIRHTSSSS